MSRRAIIHRTFKKEHSCIITRKLKRAKIARRLFWQSKQERVTLKKWR